MLNAHILLGLIIGFTVGAVIFGGLVWFFFRERLKRLEEYEIMNRETAIDLSDEKDKNIRLETILEEERKAAQEKLSIIEKAEENLKNTFKALSLEALSSNNQQFLELAKTELGRIQSETKGTLDQGTSAIKNLVKPLADNLQKYESQIRDIEGKRNLAYGSITEQVRSLIESQGRLEQETGKLVNALSKPHVCGHWGEIQLRKIVEYAGMLEHCDFVTQESVRTDDGILRPDLIMRIPGGLHIVVDAKTPLYSFLEAVKSTDEEERKTLLEKHARNVKKHITDLSSKKYWKQFEPSPDFVIMFIPGEPFYLAALQQDPELLSIGIKNRVILASPTTLIALLKVAAIGWKQEQIADNAKKISVLGKELYTRMAVFAEHLETLGKNIASSVSSYNKTIGTLETRVLVSARRFNSLGVSWEKPIKEVEPLYTQPREIQSPELKDKQ